MADPVLPPTPDTGSASLTSFALADLAQFTFEKTLPPTSSRDHLIMMVGRDDVHDALKYVLGGVKRSLYLNMFGYDDEELNDLVMALACNPSVTVLITLDKSQAGGVHEKRLLDADKEHNLADFNTHFAVGQSATHQISHTKGFVADGLVGCHGSTNWSDSGEGTFVVKGQPGGVGYRCQNNTQSFFLDTYSVARFQAELVKEHVIAQAQAQKAAAKAPGKS